MITVEVVAPRSVEYLIIAWCHQDASYIESTLSQLDQNMADVLYFGHRVYNKPVALETSCLCGALIIDTFSFP